MAGSSRRTGLSCYLRDPRDREEPAVRSRNEVAGAFRSHKEGLPAGAGKVNRRDLLDGFPRSLTMIVSRPFQAGQSGFMM